MYRILAILLTLIVVSGCGAGGGGQDDDENRKVSAPEKNEQVNLEPHDKEKSGPRWNVVRKAAIGKFINQPNCPVKIKFYRAPFNSGIVKENRHSLGIIKNSPKQIFAIQINVMLFDIWDEYEYTIVSNHRDVGNETSFDWTETAKEHTMTNVAYINKVRFNDGTIWMSNRNDITKGLDELYKDR